ncbi:MAG: antitoxin family protein [Anaerolineae bacterium]|nr:antitoxin family protein [Anaerolineae bacterium]
MNYRVPAIYEKGVLRLLEPLDLPEHTNLTVTVRVSKTREQAAASRPRAQYPTRPQPLSMLKPLIGAMPAGGDALKDSEALYDEDW